LLIFIHIEHICSFFVAFFSATIDDTNLIFGHKLHIGTPYRGKRFGPIRFLLPVCRLCWFLYTLKIYAHFSSHFSQQILMAEIWYFVTSFIYRQWTKVFERFWFSIYISYKTTIFQIIILRSIHVQFWYLFYQQKQKSM
jgi:hypothetical protein